jgi:L-fucose mutarotase/ribose pyranase (RbsD/FucU family)
MFTIEKDIPNGNLSAEIRKVLSEMETGDSFAYSDATPSRSVDKTIRAIARQLGYKVSVRKLEDGKYRVWKL